MLPTSRGNSRRTPWPSARPAAMTTTKLPSHKRGALAYLRQFRVRDPGPGANLRALPLPHNRPLRRRERVHLLLRALCRQAGRQRREGSRLISTNFRGTQTRKWTDAEGTERRVTWLSWARGAAPGFPFEQRERDSRRPPVLLCWICDG